MGRLAQTLGFMNTAAPLLENLKSLQHQRGEVSPFKTHTDFLVWVDKVTPLLAFNIKLHDSFSSSARFVDIRTKMPGVEYDVAGVNDCIGTLNQAIAAYEIQNSASLDSKAKGETIQRELTWPATFTLKWWFEHAPVSSYFSLFSALAASFFAGVWFNDFRTTIQSKPLSVNPPITLAPIKASAASIAASNASAVKISPPPSAAK